MLLDLISPQRPLEHMESGDRERTLSVHPQLLEGSLALLKAREVILSLSNPPLILPRDRQLRSAIGPFIIVLCIE